MSDPSGSPPDLPTPSFLDEVYRLELPGAELYFELAGPKDAPALFYLHGGPGYNSSSFRDLAGEDLSDYRVIYADQRGSGRSPAQGDEALAPEGLANDVVTILDALDLPRTSLLAHGFGALVAASVAARYPERVSKLVLVNPWVDLPRLARALQREAAHLSGQSGLALPPERELTEGEAPEPAELIAQATSLVSGKALLDAVEFPKPGSRLRLEHADAESFVGLSESDLPEADIWSLRADLSGVRQTTVVLVGKDDKTCYPDQAEVVLEAMPHALMSLLDTGHYPWLDDPETFISLLHQAMALPEAQT